MLQMAAHEDISFVLAFVSTNEWKIAMLQEHAAAMGGMSVRQLYI